MESRKAWFGEWRLRGGNVLAPLPGSPRCLISRARRGRGILMRDTTEFRKTKINVCDRDGVRVLRGTLSEKLATFEIKTSELKLR